MSQVYVSPNSDTGTGALSIILVILILVILGTVAYFRGWFSMSPTTVDPTPGSNINITLPTPTPEAAPTAKNYQFMD